MKRPSPNQDPFGGNGYGVRSRSKTTKVVGADKSEVGKGHGYEWLRFSAATEYVTNLAGVSVRDMCNTPPFNQVGMGSMQRWCIEDEWVSRRQRYFQDIRAEIEARIAEKLVQTRVNQLKEIDTIFEELVSQVKTTKANTKEGLVTALVRLMAAGDTMRDKLAQEVVPAHLGGAQQDTMPVVPKLTEEEAREAARAILHRRRSEMRQRTQSKKEITKGPDSPEKPQLRVVKGPDDG